MFLNMKKFSRLFKPKFYMKCESCVSTIKKRLEIVQNKRKAVEKFLKKDIAELLRCGLDYNAFGRVAGLLMEYNMSSCYELIEKFTGCISNHLEELSKQRDCPDESKEAVQSLIYAAARFSDLPELLDLRTLFAQKFGNSLEPYTSKEFVEKLRKDPPTKEMKIQFLHDIAAEFSIEWDSKALEQRLYRPPSMREERTEHDLQNGSNHEEWNKNNYGAISKTDGRDQSDFPSQGRKDISDDSSEDETSTDMSSQDGRKDCSSSVGSVSEGEVETKRPFYYRLIPPPYFKPKAIKDESKLEKTTDSTVLAEKESNFHLPAPVVQEKPKPRSVRGRPLKPQGHDSLSVRGTSLPPESTTMKASKGHVHPKLPDYDDLVARLSSMKGR